MIFDRNWFRERKISREEKEKLKRIVNEENCMVCGNPLEKYNIALEFDDYGNIEFVRHATCKREESKDD